MPTLTLRRRQRTKFALPYWVSVNGQTLGIMRTPEVRIEMPPGTFDVAVELRFGVGKWTLGVGGHRTVTLTDTPTALLITDHELLWNILFDIDLVLWLASFFFTLPAPWDTVYHVISDGFFALWILRIIIIRRRYFILKPATP